MRRILRRSTGFTYIVVCFLVIIMGILLMVTGQVWKTMVQRDREEELLFRGLMYKRAIARWYKSTPPQALSKLEDLLNDPRGPNLGKKYIPRLLKDPMTGGDWNLLRGSAGEIVGVASTSPDMPFKMTNFPEELSDLEGAKQKYSDWLFTYVAQPTTSGQTNPTTTTQQH